MSPITLLIIVVVASIVLGLGGFFLLRSKATNPVSRQAKKFFASPQIQPIMLISEDGVARLMEFTIPVAGFLQNKVKDGAWHLVHQLMLPMQGMRRHVLILTERNTLPYNPFVTLSKSKIDKINNLDAIADEGGAIAVKDGIRNSRNNMIASALVICACAIALVFIIFVGFSIWKNGGIHLNLGGGGE